MARNKSFNQQDALCKAVKLFNQKGYHATSMQDLVDHMEINRSSLYDTFGDKHEVFLEALKQYHQSSSLALVNMINEAQDIKLLLARMLNDALNMASCDNKLGCFMVNSSIEMAAFDSDVDRIVQESSKVVEDALCIAIEKAVSNGTIANHKNPRALSRFIVNTINGLRVASRTSAPKEYYEDVVNVALSTVC